MTRRLREVGELLGKQRPNHLHYARHYSTIANDQGVCMATAFDRVT
ncbi:MAG: hypothetical protein ABSA52_18020 [Candidatus Binatia bacterium]